MAEIIAKDPIARELAKTAMNMAYGYYPGSDTEQDCKAKAQKEGGLAWDEDARKCWKVFGKQVKIEENQNTIKEGFEIVNFNFHASGGSGSAVPTSSDLPGGTSGMGSPGQTSSNPFRSEMTQ